MKHLRKFNAFTEAAAAEPATKPSTKPSQPTVEPGTKPERRDRPSPVRRDKPSVSPDPKAKSMKKVKAEEVAEKFISLSKEAGYDIKKHFPKI